MIILTGGAGFIGSCMLRRLNDEGLSNILLVDTLDHPMKRANLKGKRYKKLMAPEAFIKAVRLGTLKVKPTAVIHMGACSATTERDASYLMANNTGFSIQLCEWALGHGARIIYAS